MSLQIGILARYLSVTIPGNYQDIKMQRSNRISLFLSTALTVLFLLPAIVIAQNPREITESSIAAMGRYKTLSGKLVRAERVKGKMVEGSLDFKLQENPRKIYIFNHKPDEGAEVIYIEGTNNNEALVNPNKTLMPNLNLDPEGDLLMKDQHHSMLNLGLRFTKDVIKTSLEQYGDDFEKYVTYKGEMSWHGRKVHVIEIEFADWKWESYTMEKTETLLQFERRTKLNANLIAEKNGMSVNSKVKAGKVLQVPNAYAKTSTLFVDKSNKMTIYQELKDEKGVFERYDYLNLKVNPSLPENTWSADNPDYGF